MSKQDATCPYLAGGWAPRTYSVSVNVLSHLDLPVAWDVLTLISVTICSGIFFMSAHENGMSEEIALFKKHPCGVYHAVAKMT